MGRPLVAAGRGRRTDGLRLDVTGVAHLFGGERGLVRDVKRRFASAWPYRPDGDCADGCGGLGVGALLTLPPLRGRVDSRGARAGRGGVRKLDPSPWRRCASPVPPPRRGEGLIEQLSPLPVSALRLDPDTVRTLERLGLKTIGALIGVPRLALARRFRGAENVVDALDRALGRKPEPLTAAPADPPPRALHQAGGTRDASRSGAPGARTAGADAGPRARGAAARRKTAVARRLSSRRQRRRGVGRDRDPQPRAEASAAAARRQGRGARSGVRLRRLRADRRLDRGSRRRTGKPGRGAVGRARAGAAGRPADGEARPPSAVRRPLAEESHLAGTSYQLDCGCVVIASEAKQSRKASWIAAPLRGSQ